MLRPFLYPILPPIRIFNLTPITVTWCFLKFVSFETETFVYWFKTRLRVPSTQESQDGFPCQLGFHGLASASEQTKALFFVFVFIFVFANEQAIVHGTFNSWMITKPVHFKAFRWILSKWQACCLKLRTKFFVAKLKPFFRAHSRLEICVYYI